MSGEPISRQNWTCCFNLPLTGKLSDCKDAFSGKQCTFRTSSNLLQILSLLCLWQCWGGAGTGGIKRSCLSNSLVACLGQCSLELVGWGVPWLGSLPDERDGWCWSCLISVTWVGVGTKGVGAISGPVAGHSTGEARFKRRPAWKKAQFLRKKERKQNGDWKYKIY